MKKIIFFLVAFVLVSFVYNVSAEFSLEEALGFIDGKEYQNTFLGIGFTLPDDWTLYSQEEIEMANQLGNSLYSGDLKKALEESQNVILMAASGRSGSPNISIQIRDMGSTATMAKAIGFQTLLSSWIDSTKEMLENSGMENVEVYVDTIIIDDKEVASVRMNYTYLGVPIYTIQADYFVDNYAVYINASAYEEGEDAKLFENLYWLK